MGWGLTVVIPAFDEECRLPRTLELLVEQLPEVVPGPWEVVVSDDGSRDGTSRVAGQWAGRGVRLVASAAHRGKGGALMAGIRVARHRRVALLDADLPVPVPVLGRMAEMTSEVPLVVGSRRLPGSTVDPPQPLGRRIGGRAFLAAVGLLGYRTSSDPQCGVKVLRSDLLGGVLEQVSCRGFAFDVELIERARRCGHAVVEVPVPWRHVPGSSLRPARDAVTTLAALTALRRRLGRESALIRSAVGPLTVERP